MDMQLDSKTKQQSSIIESFKTLTGKIGLFGGSFDPIQLGHLEIAQRAMKHHALDSLVFMPAYQNPLKGAPGASSEERLEMLEIALREHPQFHLSPKEIKRDSVSYSIDTVTEIISELPSESTLYFIAGSDCLDTIHQWKGFHTLLEKTEFSLLSRDTDFSKEIIHQRAQGLSDAEEEKLSANAIICPVISISSTQVRNAIKTRGVPHDLLPNGVGEYISRKNLYTE